MAKKLSTRDSAKLLNYIINQNPVLKEELPLKIQGKSVQKIGELIMSCERYRNAFINTCNMIALTLIVNDEYENPWEEFTNQGAIQFGQTVREMIMDLVEAKDYNEHMNSATDFLNQEVPNIFNYFHDLNFQKFYKVTVNDDEISLAFTEENSVYNFVAMVYTKLRTSYNYDRYLVDKYQIQRRLVDGTIPSVKIPNFATNETRENVAFMKEYSNNMIFMSPNYNPAGLRKATPFAKQRTIISTGFEARLSTMVFATSYYKDEAEMRTKLAMIDGFAKNDWSRLANLLGDSYTPFTGEEIEKLESVAGMIIADDFFKDFYKKLNGDADTESTEFRNPETLARTMWLHAWRIFSTSPFANCLCFTTEDSKVNSVTVSPSNATVTKGQKLQLNSIVDTDGITNKSVSWGLDDASVTKKAIISESGELSVPANYDNTGSGTAGVYEIDIDTILETGDKISVNGVEYTVDATSQDTIAKQITALKSALNDAKVTDYYTIGGTTTKCTLTEKSGLYGLVGEPEFVFTKAEGSDGDASIEETTAGVHAGNIIVVTATSIFDKTKYGTATITVA